MMSLGAQDYLLVPELTGPMLDRAIHNTIERHLIREEHSRAGHLLEVLMDNIPDSIYFKDRASQFVMINRDQAKKFGLADPHLATGKSDADFFKPTHAQQALADEQRVMQTGQPLVGIEEKETWPDGRETWVSTTKMPLRDRAERSSALSAFLVTSRSTGRPSSHSLNARSSFPRNASCCAR